VHHLHQVIVDRVLEDLGLLLQHLRAKLPRSHSALSLAALQGRRELEDFFARWYGPDRLTIAVVGDATADQACARLKKQIVLTQSLTACVWPASLVALQLRGTAMPRSR
jgi:hypothetical protein